MGKSWEDFQIEEESSSSGTCECCGYQTISISGFISDQTENHAAYFVTYTNDQPKHGAEFTYILGNWGQEATANERFVVVLHHFPERGFMIDSGIAEKKANMRKLAGNFLDRDDIVGSNFAESLFRMVDAVYMTDTRLDEIRNWKTDA